MNEYICTATTPIKVENVSSTMKVSYAAFETLCSIGNHCSEKILILHIYTHIYEIMCLFMCDFFISTYCLKIIYVLACTITLFFFYYWVVFIVYIPLLNISFIFYVFCSCLHTDSTHIFKIYTCFSCIVWSCYIWYFLKKISASNCLLLPYKILVVFKKNTTSIQMLTLNSEMVLNLLLSSRVLPPFLKFLQIFCVDNHFICK